MKEELSAKDKLFCHYFVWLGNAKEAAIKAGYSFVFADSTAAKLLENKKITAYIKKITNTQKNEAVELAKTGLHRLCFGCINDAAILAANYEKLSAEDILALDLFNVSEMKRLKDGCFEIKFFDRIKAFEKLLEIGNSQDDGNKISEFYSALELGAKNLTESCDSGEV